MDKYYGNVCELDIIFNFQKAYFILDELLLAGEMQESSKKNVLRVIGAQDSQEEMEVSVRGCSGILGSAHAAFCRLCTLAAEEAQTQRLRRFWRFLVHQHYERRRAPGFCIGSSADSRFV